MKHEHVHEITVSPELQEVIDDFQTTVDDTVEVFRSNAPVLLLGIVIGAIGMRVFSRPTINVEISIPKE